MIWAALLGGGIGGGIWLIARAVAPPARPLRVVADELLAPRAALARELGGGPGADVRRRWQRLAATLAGTPSPQLAADLAVLGRTSTRHTLDQLGYAAVFAVVGLAPSVLFPLLGVGTPVMPMLAVAALLAAAGWLYPALEVRTRAVAARREWARALTVYVDIVSISLAGGAGVEDALTVAAGVGRGPQFEELQRTLRVAQTRRRTLWHALDALGARADIVPLRELAAAVDLAAESGSRIRETLIAKAGAMRVRQLTESEADAQKASETMGIAPALMAVAAVVLIGFPAVARFFE